MAAGGFLPDEYTWRARLAPALLVVLPVGLTVLAWSPGGPTSWGALWSLLVSAGGTLLMSQLARDWGKRKERALFDRFGGRPTEMMLSHVHARNRNVLLARHDKLRRLRPDLRVPTEVEEARDPYAAFKVYEACTGHLISATRKKESFPLVFEENCNYGFRRNLWGMKPLGISIALAAIITLGARLYLQISDHQRVVPVDLGFVGLTAILLAIWLLRITPGWVMIPAREYASRLMEALENLK